MSSLGWQRVARDLTSDVDGVKTTYSSWDTCMQKSYCKWPAIVCIIIAALILLSLLSCLFRCLCCGAECCCGCLSCCNACCPSPRRSRKDGYHQQPSPYPPPPPQGYPQYHSQPAPMYLYGGASGYRNTPQTATFDAPSSNRRGGAGYNEDALPAMPGWDNAQTRHVVDDDVEMEKLQHPQAAQRQTLLPQSQDHGAYGGPYHGQTGDAAGDLGAMHANPYHDHIAYNQPQSYVSSPVESTRSTVYPPTYHSNAYEAQPSQQQWGQHQGYAPSIPPSYHTAPMSPVTPVGRRPVQGSWRDV